MMNFVLARVSTSELQGDVCPIPTAECESRLDSFKFDRAQSMKFLRNLGDPFSLRPKVSTMKALCRKANRSEKFYRCISEDQWLRTAIVSPAQVDKDVDSDTRVAIHSNVLPSKAYLTRWKFICAMPVDSSVCPADSFRGFFPVFLLEKCLPGSSRIMDVDERSMKSSSMYDDRSFMNRIMDGDWRSMKFSSTKCSALLDLGSLRKELLEWIKERREQQLYECHLASELQRCQNARNGYMPSRDRKSWSVAVSEVESVRQLGGGAQGAVWKVQWNGGMFAMKVFTDETARNNEASIALLVSHPNVVHYFGVSDPEYGFGGYRLLMELLDTDLHTELSRTDNVDRKPLSSDIVKLEVLLQIAQAMEHLHKEEVVHGDLKPGNILLGWFELINPDEKYCLAKVADLGSAQRVESFRCQGGTTLYAAPEVLRWRRDKKWGNEQPLKSDVYSFGIVVYQVLTGLLEMEQIYGNIRLREFTRGVRENGLRPPPAELGRYPQPLRDLVERCLFEQSAQRPTFSEICCTIQSLMDAPPEARNKRKSSENSWTWRADLRFTGMFTPVRTHGSSSH